MDLVTVLGEDRNGKTLVFVLRVQTRLRRSDIVFRQREGGLSKKVAKRYSDTVPLL